MKLLAVLCVVVAIPGCLSMQQAGSTGVYPSGVRPMTGDQQVQSTMAFGSQPSQYQTAVHQGGQPQYVQQTASTQVPQYGGSYHSRSQYNQQRYVQPQNSQLPQYDYQHQYPYMGPYQQNQYQPVRDQQYRWGQPYAPYRPQYNDKPQWNQPRYNTMDQRRHAINGQQKNSYSDFMTNLWLWDTVGGNTQDLWMIHNGVNPMYLNMEPQEVIVLNALSQPNGNFGLSSMSSPTSPMFRG